MNTTDLSKFNYDELGALADILDEYMKNGFPEGFYNDEVVPMLNTRSRSVFLINSDYQCAMLNGDTLEIWHCTPYDGHEGFLDDLIDEMDKGWNIDDIKYVCEFVKSSNDDSLMALLNIKLKSLDLEGY